ncbi:MAG: hypothetical protein HYX49_03960 [Chloroflexi bacterium]|nr:hypothetical protein [Chloroflexota bacterium]
MTDSPVKSKSPPELSVLIQKDEPVPPATLDDDSLAIGSSGMAGLFHVEDQRLVSAKRLIVLVPNWDVDEVEIARQVWKLAMPLGLAVLFLGLCTDITEELSMHRRLATLASLTRDPRLSVDTRLEIGRNWMRKLKAILQSGDVVVCHAEQRVGFWRITLREQLSKLNAPIWTLEGIHPPMKSSAFAKTKEAIFWLVSIVVIVVFFWLQVSIVHMSKDWAHSVLIYLSMLSEIGLLWIWHSVSM